MSADGRPEDLRASRGSGDQTPMPPMSALLAASAAAEAVCTPPRAPEAPLVGEGAESGGKGRRRAA